MNLDDTNFMIDSPDNPYDPYKDFDHWNDYDCSVLHFYTYQYIARLIDQNGGNTDELFSESYSKAVDDLIDVFPDRYIKLHEGEKKIYKPTE